MSNYILPENTDTEEFYLLDRDHNVIKVLYKGKELYYEEKELASKSLAVDYACSICGKRTGSPHRLKCNECIEKENKEKYLKMPFKVWDRITPLCIFNTDTYFYGEDEIFDYCEDLDIKIEDIDLVICERVSIPEFDIDDFLSNWFFGIDDDEYGAIDKDTIEGEINKILYNHLNDLRPWEQGKYRTAIYQGVLYER